MLGSEARQGALQHPISASCIGDGNRTLERWKGFASVNLRCDARSPSGTYYVHCLPQQRHVWSSDSRSNSEDKPSSFGHDLMSGRSLQGAAVGDLNPVGPALRAVSSCNTTGRQATLLSACSRPSILRRDVADVVFCPCHARCSVLWDQIASSHLCPFPGSSRTSLCRDGRWTCG